MSITFVMYDKTEREKKRKEIKKKTKKLSANKF